MQWRMNATTMPNPDRDKVKAMLGISASFFADYHTDSLQRSLQRSLLVLDDKRLEDYDTQDARRETGGSNDVVTGDGSTSKEQDGTKSMPSIPSTSVAGSRLVGPKMSVR